MGAVKLVYIAGKFRGPTAWDVAENIRAAERYGFRVAQLGAMPLIPHANTAHFNGTITDQFWIDGTLELLKRCDGAVFIPGWLESVGARAEHAYAEKNGMAIFGAGHFDSGDLERWIRS